MLELVADIGNTRIKSGECGPSGLTNTVACPLDVLDTRKNFDVFPHGNSTWTLAGTNPLGRDRLATWLLGNGDTVRILDDYRQLPISVRVDHPDRVGIDRLLNAVAVLPKGLPAIIIDAGSAVTVDLVDVEGCFRGGAIFPGFRLMAKSLNDYTAKLPLIVDFSGEAILPATNTQSAIAAGIANAIHGGIDRIVAKLAHSFKRPRIYLAGGDAERLAGLDCRPELAGPFLTLEGIRIAAQKQS